MFESDLVVARVRKWMSNEQIMWARTWAVFWLIEICLSQVQLSKTPWTSQFVEYFATVTARDFPFAQTANSSLRIDFASSIRISRMLNFLFVGLQFCTLNSSGFWRKWEFSSSSPSAHSHPRIFVLSFSFSAMIKLRRRILAIW